MMPNSMKFAKKSEDKNKISKNEGYFFRQHPLVEKSPTATELNFYLIASMTRNVIIICHISYNRRFDA